MAVTRGFAEKYTQKSTQRQEVKKAHKKSGGIGNEERNETTNSNADSGAGGLCKDNNASGKGLVIPIRNWRPARKLLTKWYAGDPRIIPGNSTKVVNER